MIRDEWLQPAATGPVCGPDLESTEGFVLLGDATRPRPEKRDGQIIRPAQEPDWADVVKRASALLGSSRDLRIVHLLARGLTHTEGLSGLRDSLQLICGLLEKFWEPLHPELVFEGEPDPILRINALAAFAVLNPNPLNADFLEDLATAGKVLNWVLDHSFGLKEPDY